MGPNAASGVSLANPNNIEKTIDAGDLASNSFFKGRVGDSGPLSFRNKIIDGRFDFWYEGTSQTTSGYGSATMWVALHAGSTKTHSKQSFTFNEFPEVTSAKYYSRTVVSSVTGENNYVRLQSRIEDARTLAGKTVTLSFYARADASRNIGVDILQYISTTSNQITEAEIFQLSTEWKRYSYTVQLPLLPEAPSASAHSLQPNFWFDIGSTFAASRSSTLAMLGQQSGTFDIFGVQLEEGSVATPFEELPPEIAKLRLSRYFLPLTIASSTYSYQGLCVSSTMANIIVQLPTLMRTTSPSISGVTGVRTSSSVTFTQTAVSASTTHENYVTISITSSGMPVWATCLLTTSGLAYLDARI